MAVHGGVAVVVVVGGDCLSGYRSVFRHSLEKNIFYENWRRAVKQSLKRVLQQREFLLTLRV
mgnify:CR=1 FL=1